MKKITEVIKSKEVHIENWSQVKIETLAWVFKSQGYSFAEFYKLAENKLGHNWDSLYKIYSDTNVKEEKSKEMVCSILEIVTVPEVTDKTEVGLPLSLIYGEEQHESEKSAEDSPSKSDRRLSVELPGFRVLDSIGLQEEEFVGEAFLLEPFIPSIGLSVLASRPDVGKSQLCRQLALEIENGSTTFVGLKLASKSYRTLVICTEDSLNDIKRAVVKQQKALGYKPKGLIHYAVGESEWNLNQLLESLRAVLINSSFDLVVVDGYGDLFDGADMNSITDTRRFLNKFDLLAKQAKTSILFNHHMTKASYSTGGSLQDVQGSGGILQKPRAVFTLTKVDKENRILRVLKGNTAPNEYKSKGVSLKFSEDTLTFSADAGLVDLPSTTSKSMDYDNLYSIAKTVFSDSGTMKYPEIKRAIEQASNVRDTQAKTYRAEMKKLGIIVEDENGDYFLNPMRREVA